MVDQLSERKNWTRYFPEGLIEFSVVMRVGALLLLGILMVVPSGLQALVAMTMLAVLWVDYVLTMCWALQIGADLNDLFDRSTAPADAQRKHIVTAMQALLPATIAFLIIAPWPSVVIGSTSTRTQVMRILLPVLGVLFVASAFFAQRALQ